uniref:TRASH domain-containing protein n=1 Tax=Cyclopterus lumpus TaxID=8103 RepID=A0A8C2Z5T8_CYCLU
QEVIHKICSDPCFLRFCTLNNLSICENCRSCCSAPLALKMVDGSKKLCDAECLAQFKLVRKIKTLQPCAMCHASRVMADMLENKNGEDAVELFCTSSCVMAFKIQAVSASGAPLKCDQCGKTTLPACHLAMPDASIRNFCTLTCAMSFKVNTTLYNVQNSQLSPKDMSASTNAEGAADRTQCDFLKPPEKLPCAQCQRIIKATPKVIQKKDKMHFVCSLACSQKFKMTNNIIAKCEYCENEKIIRDVKKVDGKVCFFCCKMLFRQELKKQWGEHCGLCAYCLSISKTRVTAKYEGANKEFCSEDCSLNYNMLLSRVAQCDTCGQNGKLRQSLPMLGEVKHFCFLRCLLHFCNKKVQMVNTGMYCSCHFLFACFIAYNFSSSPRPSGTIESSPIIANVISLASALAKQPSASASPTQLDTFVPKVIVLPVPVPLYVPLPMNMYSQYTPKPLCLPIPLPVPVFLPTPTVKSAKEEIQPDQLEEELGFTSEMKKVHEREDRVVTTKGPRQEGLASSGEPCDEREGVMLLVRLRKDSELKGTAESRALHHQALYLILLSYKIFYTYVFLAGRKTRRFKRMSDSFLLLADALPLDQDVLRCSASELSDGLCCFIREVKRPDGEPYSPDGLFYLCLSIQQYLFDNDRLEDIFNDLTYNKFATKFTRILKSFKPSTADGYIHSRVEEGFLWDCKQLGAYSPIVLLNTLLFFCCKYFGFTTVEQHRQLSFAHVMRCTKTNPNNTNTTFLRFHLHSINEAETDGVPAKKRKRKKDILEMMENTENPLRCPVSLYEFYLSKPRTDLFYLLPDRRCVPNSPLWFCSTPLDDGTMEAMLVRIMALRELRGPDGGSSPSGYSKLFPFQSSGS